MAEDHEITEREILQFGVTVSQQDVKGVPIKVIKVPVLTTVLWTPEAQEKVNNLADYIAKTVGEILDQHAT